MKFSRAWMLLTRLDSLRFKLFVAIGGANAVLALIAYLVISRSFDQGLGDYLNRADEARLKPLIVRLAEGHHQYGDWTWLTAERERWPELMLETLGVGRSRRDNLLLRAERRGILPAPTEDTEPPEAQLDYRRPPPEDADADLPPAVDSRGRDGRRGGRLLTIDPRLMLFDADGRLLIGHISLSRMAVKKPIAWGGHIVGYLGYVPRLNMVQSLEKVYSARQNRKFAAIAGGMVLVGLLVSALLAHWLTRRIRGLAHGAAALIQGEYTVRIAVDGHDELAQLGEDFNRLAATLEAARSARQRWIADIAHELRTPLAILRAEIEALQDGIRPLGQQSLGSLAQEVGQLTRLVEDLHLLSMSDLGALTYRHERVALAAIIDDCVAAQSHHLAQKGITVELTLDRHLQILADPARIAQVLANLLQNTVRYTDAPGCLQVTLYCSGVHAVVVWQDSSPGVAAVDLPRLTERLYRVEASRSRQGGGSGLGLAIARAIVEGHDGNMQAEASPLGGLHWTIVLPLADAVNSSLQGDYHG